MTRKTGFGILNEIMEFELDYTEQDYMRIKGHKRSHGTFKNLKVMAKSHMMSFDMVKIVKGTLMSLEVVYFHIHSLILIHDQFTKTEHYS